MKAIILASGVGRRLRPLTDELPKPLVKVGGKELLARILDTLVARGITEVVFTTGHMEDKIKQFVQSRYPSLHTSFVLNPRYSETNYIYSLWLAKEAIGNEHDVLLFHSDMLFDPALLDRLLSHPKSGVLVQKGNAISPKDFNARVEDDVVKEVRVKISGPNVSFCAPIYKLKAEDLNLWMAEIEKFVQQERLSHYSEDAFNEMIPQLVLHPVYFEDHELCMEVDDFEDLEKATKLLAILKK